MGGVPPSAAQNEYSSVLFSDNVTPKAAVKEVRVSPLPSIQNCFVVPPQ